MDFPSFEIHSYFPFVLAIFIVFISSNDTNNIDFTYIIILTFLTYMPNHECLTIFYIHFSTKRRI